MAERFVSGLAQHVLFWSGWAFTIAGTVAALWIGWVGVLVAFVGIASAMSFAYQKHTEKLADERVLEKERGLREEAERKVSELPLETLLRIQQIIASTSVKQVMELLVRHTEYVVRMVQFMACQPLDLRTFDRQAGEFYAVAQVEKSAIEFLRVGDPFVLTLKGPAGLVTDSARMIVHQRNEKKASVFFLVQEFLGDEMTHLEALAEKRKVAGLTGYSVRPLCSIERYGGLNVTEFANLIRALTDEISQNEGFEK